MSKNNLSISEKIIQEIRDYFSSREDPDYMRWDPDIDERASINNLMNEDVLAPWDNDDDSDERENE